MKRLTYSTNNKNIVSKLVIGGGNLLKVTINPMNDTVKITDSTDKHIFFVGRAGSVKDAKALARKELKLLGVTFVDEVRQTK